MLYQNSFEHIRIATKDVIQRAHCKSVVSLSTTPGASCNRVKGCVEKCDKEECVFSIISVFLFSDRSEILCMRVCVNIFTLNDS